MNTFEASLAANPKLNSMLVKVPAVTAFFWIIKVLSTTVGETFADYLNGTVGLGLGNTAWVMTGVLAVILVIQFATRKYIPVIYWLAIVAISTVGTLITDNLHDGLGWQNWQSAIVFGVLLIVTFYVWWRQERTLSIKSINTFRRELFYWIAILATFSLGTAAGDILLDDLGVPLVFGTLIYAVAIALVAVAWRLKFIGTILAFWLVYILTRPLGASLGDLLSLPAKETGLGFGPTNTTLVFLGLIAALVAYLSISKRDVLKA